MSFENVPKVEFKPLHRGQKGIYRQRTKRNVIRCGRRYGKTTMFEQLASSWAMHGEKVGFFAPSHKLWSPSFTRILDVVYPAVKHSNKSQGLITLHNGAEIEFWTLSDEDAGRSRFYDHAIIDEASLVPGLRDIWEKSIAPTLLDRGGDAWMAGTPKGIDEESYFYLACTDKTLLEKWQEFHAPTSANPLLDAAAVAHLESTNLPLVWAQEYCAEFVSWAGEALMSLADMLIDGQGVPYPTHCDYIYATVDSAMKDGTEHDGTAVCYWARNLFAGTPAILLDWDIQQITAATLTDWLPGVLDKMGLLGNECGARHPPLCWIEDKSSGTMLIQHAQGKGWPVEAIDGKITAQGKDGRAVLASSPLHMGKVKLSQYAHDKVTAYKGVTRNHLESQVCGYRVNDKDAAKRADDLSDAFCYGVIAAFGDNEGF
jgi:hypothetical protein